MVAYRRTRIPGGSYFFTLALADRGADLLVAHIDVLRDSFREVLAAHPVKIEAIVVLPDHLHAIWTLPPGDADYSTRWKLIKNGFTRRLRAIGCAGRPNARREYPVWQRRFWEHFVRDEEDFAGHVAYVHYNPVKHLLVNRVQDWRWSSFHRHVAAGKFPADWGGGQTRLDG